MSPPPEGARLVVILSPERSGSTLLSVMLGAHSRVLAPPELHLLRYPDLATWRSGYPVAGRSLHALLAMLPEAERPTLAGLEGLPMEDVYRALLCAAGRERILVDKTPAYAHPGDALERAERLEPFYVWLVRHPLAVAASRIERLRATRSEEQGLAAWLKYPFFLARESLARATGRELGRELAHWRDAHTRIEGFLTGIPRERQIVIGYERLVKQPKRELERLCRALALDPEPAMLEPRAHAPQALGRGVGDEKVLHHASIDPQAADRWRASYEESALDPATGEVWQRLTKHLVLDEATNT